MLAQLLQHLFVMDAPGMSGTVQIAHLYQHDVGLGVILQNIQSRRHGKQIQTPIRPFEIAAVLIEISVQQGGSSGVTQVLLGFVARVTVRDDHGQIHIIVRSAGNGPTQRTGGQAFFTGSVQQGRHFYVPFHAEPGFPQMTAPMHIFVVNDAVALHIAAGENGGVAAVCQSRPYGADLFHQGCPLEEGTEVGHFFHIGNIAGAQGVYAENQYLAHWRAPFSAG